MLLRRLTLQERQHVLVGRDVGGRAAGVVGGAGESPARQKRFDGGDMAVFGGFVEGCVAMGPTSVDVSAGLRDRCDRARPFPLPRVMRPLRASVCGRP